MYKERLPYNGNAIKIRAKNNANSSPKRCEKKKLAPFLCCVETGAEKRVQKLDGRKIRQARHRKKRLCYSVIEAEI